MEQWIPYLLCFSLGALFGVTFGPAHERLNSYYVDGFIAGIKEESRRLRGKGDL